MSRRFNVGKRFESGNSQALADALLEISGSYTPFRDEFLRAGAAMLTQLDLDAYGHVIAQILKCAAAGETSAVRWLGTPVDRSDGTPEEPKPLESISK